MSEVTGAATRQVQAGRHGSGGHILPFWRAVYEVARKDVLIFTRTKRIYIFGGIFTLGLLLVTLIFSSLVNDILGDFGQEIDALGLSRANLIMAFAFAFPVVGAGFWLFALGIVFAFDAVVREYEDRSLFLVLSKPVSREAFVLGKYLGATFSVTAVFLAVATVCYFVVQLLSGSFASFGDIGRYYLGILYIVLAMSALAALALFGSAIARTTVTSIVFSLATWIIGLNVLSNVRVMYSVATRTFEQEPWWVSAFQYTNPNNALGPAVGVMVNQGRISSELGDVAFLSFFGGIGLNAGTMLFALLAFIGVFLGAALLVVNKRNFE